MPKTGLVVRVASLLLCGGACAAVGTPPSSAPADAAFIVDHWTPDEGGLPQSSVISVIQTRDGYLWLGTLNGLVRFDGLRFTVFDESNTPGLNSSRIVHLFEDSHTNLWVGTETAGIALVKPGGEVRSLGIGRGRREGRLVAACEDATGAVWLYTADGQLCRHQAGKVDVWDFDPGRFSQCRALAAEAERVWVGSDWELTALGPLAAIRPPELPRELVLPVGKLDFLLASAGGGYWRLANGRVQKCRANTLERDFGLYPWKSGARVSSACEDRDGHLIVGTLDEISGDGVFWFGADGQAARISTAQGLTRDGVLSVCVDREGSLWVGTDGGGLNRVKPNRFRLVPGSKGRVAQTVCESADGGLWLGFTDGAALRTTETVKQFGPAQGLSSKYEQNVTAVFVDQAGQAWFGTGSGLFSLRGQRLERVEGPGAPPSALRTAVMAIHQDRQGRLWIGTQAGLVRWDGQAWAEFGSRNGLSAPVVRALADDAEGNLWIGTTGGGLNRLRDGNITVFRKQAGALPGDDISALLVDGDGVLWVGTSGSGLARLAQGRWTRYTTAEGLASHSIGYLLEDEQDHLWIGSYQGLMRVPKQALNDFAAGATNAVPCRVYGRRDGLPTGECTQGSQPAAWRARNGRLFFPTIQGVVSVNPADLAPNPFPPPVVIESVWIQGQAQNTNTLRAAPLQTVVVPPGRERLELRYTSLNLAAPDRARFQYRMAGYEAEWADAGERRVAPYPKLPPGEYAFQVRAANEDGVWSEPPASLAVVVEPPFWRTWWFLGTSGVALLAGIVGTVHLVSTQKLKRQLRQQRALEKERSRIARDLHDQLGANLTQVSLLGELVESDKELPQEVEAHAQQISQTARETTRALDEIVWATNPANDTLEGLITYVCKYAQEYFALAGLRYRLEVPSPLPTAPLPPEVRHNVFLAAKEAVNNIVKHAQATSAWVRLQLEPGRFTLEIHDDGRGVSDAARTTTRNGLKNMRKRLEDVGGAFTIGPAPDGGTLVRLVAPVQSQP